jgi:hypothetical protein
MEAKFREIATVVFPDLFNAMQPMDHQSKTAIVEM